MTRDEAHAVMFRGQANVAQMAKRVGVSTEDLKASFRLYAIAIPKTDDAWQADVELSWPWC